MKRFLTVLLCALGFMFYASSTYALTFDLVGPTGELTRGQDVVFKINIDTEGKSLSTASVGMTYETQYLEYVSTAPGDSFTTVSANVLAEGGKLVLTGVSTTPYSGSGTFANVTFKLIATEAGSTELCALYNPETTPTLTPAPGVPTSPPAPTALPKTGEGESTVQGAILASLFFVAAGISLFVFKKT
jgi:hypothetical protein